MASKKDLILENYISGQFIPCASYLDSYDPSIGEVYCKVPDSGKEEVSCCIDYILLPVTWYQGKDLLETAIKHVNYCLKA